MYVNITWLEQRSKTRMDIAKTHRHVNLSRDTRRSLLMINLMGVVQGGHLNMKRTFNVKWKQCFINIFKSSISLISPWVLLVMKRLTQHKITYDFFIFPIPYVYYELCVDSFIVQQRPSGEYKYLARQRNGGRVVTVKNQRTQINKRREGNGEQHQSEGSG